MIVYLDASALVKRYVAEAGSDEVRALVRGAEAAVTALITRVEVIAALAKAHHTRRLASQDADRARKAFEEEWEDFVRVQMTEHLVAQAASLAWSRGLRGYDAVHLAAALFWQAQIGRPVVLATYDRQLWEAARGAGLTVWPEEHL